MRKIIARGMTRTQSRSALIAENTELRKDLEAAKLANRAIVAAYEERTVNLERVIAHAAEATG